MVFHFLFWWLAVSFLRRPEVFGSINTAFFEPMAGLILGVGFHTDHSIMVSIPLWFLPGIFCAKMLSSITAQFHKKKKIFIMVAITIFALVLWHTKCFLPISLGSAFMCFPIYYAGILFRKNKPNSSRVIRIFIFIGSVAVLITTPYVNGVTDVNHIQYGKYPVLFWIGAFAGIIVVCLLS